MPQLRSTPLIQMDQNQLQLVLDQIETSTASKQSKNAFRPPEFSGRDSENALTFLDNFDLFSDYTGLTNAKKSQLFPLLLKSTARVWFNQLTETVQKDIVQLLEAFRLKFNSPDMKWLFEQSLLTKTKNPKESLEDYLSDIALKCERLNKAPEDRIQITLRGLPTECKKFIISRRPTTLTEVETLAKLFYELQKFDDDPPKPPIAAMQPDATTLLVQMSHKIADLSNEIQKLKTQPENEKINFQNARTPQNPQSVQNRRYTPPNRYQQNPSRTTDGRIRCSNCNRIGHHHFHCRSQQTQIPFCDFCQKSGHSTRDCFNRPRLQNSGNSSNQAQRGN